RPEGQKNQVSNVRKSKGKMRALEADDLTAEHAKKIAKDLDVPEADVVSMNRRLAAPDHSLNAPMRIEGEGEWQDWLVDDAPAQDVALAEREEVSKRRKLLTGARKQAHDA